MGERATLGDLFYRGRHREVCRRTVDSKSGLVRPGELSYVVGSLCFLGRLDEARWLLEKGEDPQPEADFYLGLGLCRHSRYGEARRVFGGLLRSHARSSRARDAFFAFQGVAFYRYFCSRPRRAIYWADRAYRSATLSGFLFGKFLSADLTGHCRLQAGDCAAGLKRLEEAGEYARLLGDGGILRANRVALACYRIQLGLEKDLGVLEDLLAQVEDQDTYTRSTLLLELGHQFHLRGAWARAREVLNGACRVIHSVGHRRHGALLNLHYAYGSFLCGDLHQGLVLTGAARSELDLQVDQPLEILALGLEHRLRRALNLKISAESRARLIVLTQRTGLERGKRQLRRETGKATLPPGEDPLGDLLDSLNGKGRRGWMDLLAAGYVGPLVPLLPGTGPRIVLGLSNTGLLLLGEDQAVWRPKGMTDILVRVLAALASGPKDKEELVQGVWGYGYDPVRHDSLIYSTMSRLRQALQPFDDWLEVSELGYQLDDSVAVHSLPAPAPARVRAPQELSLAEERFLNPRQGETLSWLGDNEWISVRDYQVRFHVSRVTASRDLSQLAKQNLVTRQGKGRATRYCLADPQAN